MRPGLSCSSRAWRHAVGPVSPRTLGVKCSNLAPRSARTHLSASRPLTVVLTGLRKHSRFALRSWHFWRRNLPRGGQARPVSRASSYQLGAMAQRGHRELFMERPGEDRLPCKRMEEITPRCYSGHWETCSDGPTHAIPRIRERRLCLCADAATSEVRPWSGSSAKPRRTPIADGHS